MPPGAAIPPLLRGDTGMGGSGRGAGASNKVIDAVKQEQKKEGEAAQKRGNLQEGQFAKDASDLKDQGKASAARKAIQDYRYQQAANQALRQGQNRQLWVDQAGVNLSQQFGCLKNQSCLTPRASQQVRGRNCVEYGGVWIDDGFQEKTPSLVVKTMSEAYFRILERQPHMKEVFQLGNYLVWIAPNGTALVLDMNDGTDKLSDGEIDRLFAAK